MNGVLQVAIISNVVAASLLVFVVAFDGPLLQMTVGIMVTAVAVTVMAACRLTGRGRSSASGDRSRR